jgi:hypothetical protein
MSNMNEMLTLCVVLEAVKDPVVDVAQLVESS